MECYIATDDPDFKKITTRKELLSLLMTEH
jgi:hypothetical protein